MSDRRRMVELREETGVQRSLTERLVRSRLQWAGHVERMADDRLPKRAAELREQGRRRRGRPRLRWEDCVKRDVRKAREEEDWKKKTRDRGGWKRLSEEGWKSCGQHVTPDKVKRGRERVKPHQLDFCWKHPITLELLRGTSVRFQLLLSVCRPLVVFIRSVILDVLNQWVAQYPRLYLDVFNIRRQRRLLRVFWQHHISNQNIRDETHQATDHVIAPATTTLTLVQPSPPHATLPPCTKGLQLQSTHSWLEKMSPPCN